MRFHEDERKDTCPKCGNHAMYWEVCDGDDGSLVDSLYCENCGMTWKRVYVYAWSECEEG